MKKKLKLIIILIIAIVAISIIPTISKAEYSAKIEVVADKTNVKPGDTVNVTIRLKDVKDAGTGVNAVSGIMKYDSNFFSSVKNNGVEGTSSNQEWYNSNTGVILLDGTTLTSDGDFKVLQFTVSNTATGSTTVNFTKMHSTTGSNEVYSDDVALTFTVGSDNNNNNDNSKDENTTPDKDKTNSSTAGNTTKNDGGASTKQISGTESTGVTSKTQLPKAGLKKGIIIAGATLLIVIIGSYALYKRYPKV